MTRSQVAFALLGFLLSFSHPLSAQQTAAPIAQLQRDPQALAVLQNSLTAMGGPAAVAKIIDTVVTGVVTPSTRSSLKSGTFRWETSGAEYKYYFQLPSATQTIVSGHGHPASVRNGTVTPRPSQLDIANAPFHLPLLVLAAPVVNQQYSIVNGGKTNINGVAALKVRIRLDADIVSSIVSVQDWYFDATTFLPLRVEHRLPDNRRPENHVLAAEEFADFRIVSGVLVPFRITSYEQGIPVATETISTVSFNNGLSTSEFDAPAGGAL